MKTKGRKTQKSVGKISKKLAGSAKKASKATKKQTSKVKGKARNLLSTAKKKLSKLKSQSSKTLTNVKDKAYATEEEILAYVKENPIKSASAVALAGLIAGFVARFRKGR